MALTPKAEKTITSNGDVNLMVADGPRFTFEKRGVLSSLTIFELREVVRGRKLWFSTKFDFVTAEMANWAYEIYASEQVQSNA